MYKNGLGVPRDYLKAKELYELALQYNNYDSLLPLGNLYYEGQGVEKNYIMAKKYYKQSSSLGDLISANKLGDMYFNGQGVKQNYSKAIKYYELSARGDNYEALFNLGKIFLNGQGVEKDYLKAKMYFELSANKNNPDALFYLGELYSSNEFINTDFSKAIENFQKCIEIQSGNIIITANFRTLTNIMTYKCNKYDDRARNDLGLLYLFDLNDSKKGIEHITKGAMNEYPYAQNNFGLLNQFYFNDIKNAEYFYEKSSKHNFALSEYNIGYIKEKNGEIDESIQYYIKASEDEDAPLIFRGIEHFDKRLSISKMFIICFVNLKLVEYYILKNNYDQSRNYFIKAFKKFNFIQNDFSYRFCFTFNYNNEKNPFSYLKYFILNFPLFNLSEFCDIPFNQDNMNFKNQKKSDIENKAKENDDTIIFTKKNISKTNFKIIKIKDNSALKQINDTDFNVTMIIDDTSKLFDFIIQDKSLIPFFIDEIKNIIQIMHEILYKPLYRILFGRITIKRQKEENEIETITPKKEDIDKNFLDGFGPDNL